jgi:DNA-binding response OmpR family regulator
MSDNNPTPTVPNILVAEDQTDLRDMITASLELSGHRVIATSDGQQAIEQAEEQHPDLIILDLHMPRVNGFEVCERLKAQETFRRVPILIMSAGGSREQIRASLDAGAQEYLAKPFDLDHLIQRVDALLTTA